MLNVAASTKIKIDLPSKEISAFCHKWQITELSLFGSILRDDFGPDSDIDVLVTFAEEAQWTLFDHVDMQTELAHILNRNVDLVSRRGVENSRNYLRRNEILETAEVLYAVE